MSWFPNNIIAEVDRLARITYLDRNACKLWNDNRRGNELRLLSGWMWTSRSTGEHRQGFKTISVCYRDAWYSLVQHRATPAVVRARLRVVKGGRAA